MKSMLQYTYYNEALVIHPELARSLFPRESVKQKLHFGSGIQKPF